MIKNLTKVGNSQAIILDRSLLEMMGLKENGKVQITVSNGSLVVTPVTPRVLDSDFDDAVEKVIEERSEVLKKLAQ
ncbi:MAG: hypothetical protein HUJ26_14610 [Planctomycetaceae bacterium]|nr:hypothetical protein [Planctomycetaceae bacterium]